jgi:Zn-dependent protease with chaperone function
MTPERYELLAARFERFSRGAPRRYRLFVALLVLAGYAFLGSWVLLSASLLAAVTAGMVYRPNPLLLKVGLGVAVFTWALLRATWVTLERPEGVEIRAGDAPVLFAEIERLRRLGRIPRIHRVLLDAQLNAGVAQTPRLGVFGWPHNDLVLGYPLLAALSPDEFRAVLAHELGHLSGRHGRTGAWAYRARATWSRFLAVLEARRSALTGIFRGFLALYGPWFSAASLALAREQEREAVRFSAVATSPRAAADALVASRLAEGLLERRFHAALRRRTAIDPEPPRDHLAPLLRLTGETAPHAGAQAELDRQLLARTGGTDTHPSLADRLATLGAEVRVPPRPQPSAASRFLGDAEPRLRSALEARWRERVADAWTAAHREATGAGTRLAALEERAGGAGLDGREAVERALLVERLRGPEEALPLARAAAEATPDHPPARFHLGRLLLGAGDAAGLAHVERAIELDGDAAFEGARLIAEHHLAGGRPEEAAPWIARAEGLAGAREEAERERSAVHATDRVEPHGLEPGAIAPIIRALRPHPRVKRAYLGRKRLRQFPDREPVFVLGVVPRWPWYRPVGGDAAERLEKELAERIGAPHLFVFVKHSRTRRMLRMLQRLPASRIC